jgi:hypothetical protein
MSSKTNCGRTVSTVGKTIPKNSARLELKDRKFFALLINLIHNLAGFCVAQSVFL